MATMKVPAIILLSMKFPPKIFYPCYFFSGYCAGEPVSSTEVNLSPIREKVNTKFSLFLQHYCQCKLKQYYCSSKIKRKKEKPGCQLMHPVVRKAGQNA